MDMTKAEWNQQPNTRMRVRHDNRYWVIAEPATWETENAHEHAARMYHGTFPIREQELGMAWGDSMEQALTNAIEILERHLPAIEARLEQEARSALLAASASHARAPRQPHKQYAEEWRL